MVDNNSSSSFNEPKAPKNPFYFTKEDYEVLTRRLPVSVPSEHSEYVEIELVEGCTLYDLYRQPRAPMMDPTAKRTFSVRSLNADLLCPICLGIVRDTMVVMECLHRFCRQCIETCLRACKNECPSCRINIPSRRSLRPDHNFDALIRTIYPNLEQFEQDEDERIAENNRVVHFNNALTKSFKVGLEKQRKMSKKKTNDPSEETTSSTRPSNSNSRRSNLSTTSSSSLTASTSTTPTTTTTTNPSTSRPTPTPPTSVPQAPAASASSSSSSSRITAAPTAANVAVPRTAVTTARITTPNKDFYDAISASKRHKPNEPESTTSNKPNQPSTLSTASSSSSSTVSATSSSFTGTTSAASTKPTSTTTSNDSGSKTAAVSFPPPGDSVNLRVLRHPEDLKSPQLQRSLFQTFSRLKIRHLKKHLCTLLPGTQHHKQMKIILSGRNVTVSGMSKIAEQNGIPIGRKDLLFDQELEDIITLKDVFDQFEQGYQWELQLYYHFDENIVNSIARINPSKS